MMVKMCLAAVCMEASFSQIQSHIGVVGSNKVVGYSRDRANGLPGQVLALPPFTRHVPSGFS